MEVHGSDRNTGETGKGLDFEYPSSILSLEPSSAGASCCTLDSKTSCITNCKSSIISLILNARPVVSNSQSYSISWICWH